MIGIGTVGALMFFLRGQHESGHPTIVQTPKIVSATPGPGVAILKAVEAAVARTNTGHIVTERTLPTKERWELWWQRKPFFYRVQAGNEVLIDDGHQQIELLSFDSQTKGKSAGSGAAFTRPSQGKIIYETIGVGDSNEIIGKSLLASSRSSSITGGVALPSSVSVKYFYIVREDQATKVQILSGGSEEQWDGMIYFKNTNQTTIDLHKKLPVKFVMKQQYLPAYAAEEQKRRVMLIFQFHFIKIIASRTLSTTTIRYHRR